ncbi:MAG: aldehyde ferredoxin oxidoreductase [Gammaproteobacteria bacterium]|nr:aldehyde ferredoxin oxidoreductase [Gammaproteobacteria bacterium]
MRKYLHIHLNDRSVDEQELHGEAIVRSGRYWIAKTLLASDAATVEPLSPDNPLIFSAGPFAGTNFSNANRTSVGCKSPLTGGIKESNAGGTFSLALGQLHLAGLTLYGASADWIVIRITKDGGVSFDPAESYLGKGNVEAAAMLKQKYGKKVSLALCGPVGEYQGLVAGIGFSDPDGRPSRMAARGGIGAVMGSKKVKAIVVDLHKMPQLHDRKKVMQAVREYGAKLREQEGVRNLNLLGTAYVADFTNHVGGLPVCNFGTGRLVDTSTGPMKMGGDYLRQQNIERGGETAHACMPGCIIECSNVYADADGNEVVSPLEYETIGLLGTNCGLSDPDDLAGLNATANDLGIDSIETGAMLAVLMAAGLADFGDLQFMVDALEDIRQGTDNGLLWAQGTARVGEHYGVERVPVIKRQAISAYDPRVIEVTGISMMLTAQGADHTAGNVPMMDCNGKSADELVAASLQSQVSSASADSLGLCIFGRSVTDTNTELLINAINDAHGTRLEPSFFWDLGRETLSLEHEFNKAAGFLAEDDELPRFFHDEPLAPSGKVARFRGDEIQQCVSDWWQQDSKSTPSG